MKKYLKQSLLFAYFSIARPQAAGIIFNAFGGNFVRLIVY